MPQQTDSREKRSKAESTPSKPRLIWLDTNSCRGDMISLLNAHDPDYQELITGLVDMDYNTLVMSAEGNPVNSIRDSFLDDPPGSYILVVEGTVPTRANGKFAVVGRRDGKPWTAMQAVQSLGSRAGYVIAIGTCASFGGPYAAAPNPTGSQPVQAVLDRKVINVPGCPANPDWFMGTLIHLIQYGEPELDQLNRPKMFYGESIHNLCQRRHYFDNSIFAEQPGEPWCMYKIGCKGPVTYADCPSRQWGSEHLSWPVKANTPCIGCASPEFPDGDEPFFQHLPDLRLPGIRLTADRVGAAVGLLTALGIGAHLTGSIITGRLAKNFDQGLTGKSYEAFQALKKLLGKNIRH
jgi:hydrogenase small subunit